MTSWLIDNLGPTVEERERLENERDAKWRAESTRAAYERERQGLRYKLGEVADSIAELRAQIPKTAPHYRAGLQADLDLLLRRRDSWEASLRDVESTLRKKVK